MAKITIVGLGPGDFDLITLETISLLQASEVILLRTSKHPAVQGLIDQGIVFESYDSFYEKYDTFEEVYQAIADDCIERAQSVGSVIFAVPGSPLVAERSVALLREAAPAANIELTIKPGMSFLEILYTRLAIDPLSGVTVVDAADLTKLPPELNTGLIVTQVYNQQVASDAKLSLMECYEDDFPVTVARNLGLKDEEVLCVPLYEIDRLPVIDHLTSIFVPQRSKPVPFSIEPLVGVMARLRSPGGCIWDIEQTHESLRRYFVEEVYEVLEAIELADADKLCEELGDVLLQIVFHARIAEESGLFTMQSVVDMVTEKLVRRHPHVFGDITVRDAAEVVVNWEKIKSRENMDTRKSILDGVSPGLPALMRAFKLQTKAAKVGFDWDDAGPVWEKVSEELAELRVAANGKNPKDIEEELGDVLFSLVNLARFLNVEAETALTSTNNKFIRRFQYIENEICRQGISWDKMTLEQLDLLWNNAKAAEIRENQ